MGIHVEGEIDFKKPIHHAIFSKAFIAGVDNETGIRIFARKANKVIGVQKFNNPTPHRHHRATGSSENGRLLVIQLFKTKTTYLMLFDTQKGKYKIVKSLNWSSDDELECSAFDPQTKLLATGGNDGRVYVYTCKNGRLFQSLPPRSDYISTMLFNDEGNLLAYSSFDRSLTVYDLHRSKLLYTGDARMAGVIMSMAFVPDTHRMVLADREGKVSLYDYMLKKNIRTMANLPAWPMSVLVDPKGRYALVGDKTGHLYLMDIAEENAIETEIIYQSTYAILQMRIFESKIYLVTENGLIKTLDYESDEKAFAEYFEAGDYNACYDLMAKNSLLYFTDTRVKLDEVFEVNMKRLLGLIALGKLRDGKRMIAPFEKDPRHQSRIAGTIKQAQGIYEFSQLIKEQQYEKAYRLAESSDLLKEVGLYERLERKFEESFDKALKFLVLMNDPIGARKAIQAFSNVAQKRALVQNLFNHPKVFRKGVTLHQKKEYQELEELALKNSYIKEAPFYQSYQRFVNNQEFFFDMHMEMEEYPEALEIAASVEKNFPKLAFAMREKITNLKTRLSFIHAVENNSVLVALRLVANNEFLTELPAYKKLDRMLGVRFDKAVESAQKGDFAGMHKILAPLYKNQQLKPRALSIYRVYYIEEMASAGSHVDDTAWKHAVKYYLKYFGRDDDLVRILRNNGKEHYLSVSESSEEEAPGGPDIFEPSIFKGAD